MENIIWEPTLCHVMYVNALRKLDVRMLQHDSSINIRIQPVTQFHCVQNDIQEEGGYSRFLYVVRQCTDCEFGLDDLPDLRRRVARVRSIHITSLFQPSGEPAALRTMHLAIRAASLKRIQAAKIVMQTRVRQNK